MGRLCLPFEISRAPAEVEEKGWVPYHHIYSTWKSQRRASIHGHVVDTCCVLGTGKL
jgi:predicted membrane-bound mannosyltransferase